MVISALTFHVTGQGDRVTFLQHRLPDVGMKATGMRQNPIQAELGNRELRKTSLKELLRSARIATDRQQKMNGTH